MDKRVAERLNRYVTNGVVHESRRDYAVSHFHCGCHIIELSPGLVDITHSHFCSNKRCKYAGAYNFHLLEETFTLEERQADYGRLGHGV